MNQRGQDKTSDRTSFELVGISLRLDERASERPSERAVSCRAVLWFPTTFHADESVSRHDSTSYSWRERRQRVALPALRSSAQNKARGPNPRVILGHHLCQVVFTLGRRHPSPLPNRHDFTPVATLVRLPVKSWKIIDRVACRVALDLSYF